MQGVFVTGTDTDVGKTTVSAGIIKAFQGGSKVTYWKPIETGAVLADDTTIIQEIIDTAKVLEPAYRFPEVMIPQQAAIKWGKEINTDEIVKVFKEKSKDGGFWILEGSGGVMLPLNDNELQLDLMKKLGLPVLVVTTGRIGSINHTLLTLTACRTYGLDVLGVILTKSQTGQGNKDIIEKFGKVKVLAEFMQSEDLHSNVSRIAMDSNLRKLLKLTPIPK